MISTLHQHSRPHQHGGIVNILLTVVIVALLIMAASAYLRSGFSNGADAPTPPTLQEQIASQGPTLLVFGATWCGPCQSYKKELASFIQAHPDVPVIEIDVDDHPELAQNYGVRGIPATVVYQDGAQVDRHAGVIRASALPGIIGR
ncbi:MAG: thioredoxin [Planctomycetota bacterium]|nr:MAG: thioredoxin [Planctomycetota bacterium]